MKTKTVTTKDLGRFTTPQLAKEILTRHPTSVCMWVDHKNRDRLVIRGDDEDIHVMLMRAALDVLENDQFGEGISDVME